MHAGEEPGGLTTPIPGSDFGFGVYTQVTVNMFADHLPLYRSEDIFTIAGMMIPRNTQFGMLVSDFTETRGRDGPAEYLADFQGHVVVDAYGVHDGAGSSKGGQTAATIYSLVSSAARCHLDVWAYVDNCLRQLAAGSTDYESLLPDVWRTSHPESIREYRDAEQKVRRLTTQQRRSRRREDKIA